MAVTARFTAPLQVLEEQAMRDRITAVADAEGISQAEVIRDILRHGVSWREQLSAERVAQSTPAAEA